MLRRFRCYLLGHAGPTTVDSTGRTCCQACVNPNQVAIR